MNKFFKISMFITSFIPLWASVVFLDILSLQDKSQFHTTEIIGLVIMGIMLLFSIVIIIISINHVSPTDFQNYTIVEVSQEKGVTSEFLLSYILPLFVFKFTEWTGIIQFLIYYLILMFLCVRNNNVYANLILELGRYKFYSCTLKWKPEKKSLPIQAIVISRENLCAAKNNTVRVAALNKPFFISKSPVE